MTNSPPCNVVSLAEGEAARVLASGVDTLVVSLQVRWQNEHWFNELHELKREAKERHESYGGFWPGTIVGLRDDWFFDCQPNGAGGYEWLLTSKELAMKIGNWRMPIDRPSMIVEFRSEYLWTVGPQQAFARVRRLIEARDGTIVECKVSRADLCVDILIPETDFRLETFRDGMVCRARKPGLWFAERWKLATMMVGKTAVSCRCYDKPREIREQSNKWWMWHIWGMEPEDLPESHRIVRVEFQLRREALKDFGTGELIEFLSAMPNVWNYCTHEWLRIVDSNDKHHTHQHVRPWWQIVQAGVIKAQQSEPVVRAKAVKADKDRLIAQVFGNAISAMATELESKDDAPPLATEEVIATLVRWANEQGLSGDVMHAKVLERRAKYQRQQEKVKTIAEIRRCRGFVSQARLFKLLSNNLRETV